MRRLALLLFVLPLSVYAYACSSDDSSTPSTEEDSGTGPGTDSGGPGDDDSGNTPVDSGNDSSTTDGGTDAGDGGDSGDAGDGGACTNPLADAPDGGTVIAHTTLKAVAVGNFPDGPQFVSINDAGTILFSQVYDGTVFRLPGDGNGVQTVFRAAAAELAIGNAAQGNFVYTVNPTGNATGGSILRTQISDGGTDGGFALATGSPNDLVAGAKYLYVSDPGYQGGTAGAVYRFDPGDGGILPITLPPNSATPDGIALSPDGTSLYVAIAGEGLAVQWKILKYSVDANGVATNPATVPFAVTGLPVGLAVDTGGNIWIAENAPANAQNGKVEVITPAGKKWGEITFADSRPTGIAFGGADNKSFYVTAERGDSTPGTLYIGTARCAGVR